MPYNKGQLVNLFRSFIEYKNQWNLSHSLQHAQTGTANDACTFNATHSNRSNKNVSKINVAALFF